MGADTLVEGEEALEDLLVSEVGRLTVGGGDGYFSFAREGVLA
jgi:hypothetical protein